MISTNRREKPVIKFIAAAIWICAATLGAVFYSFQAAGERGVGETPKPTPGGSTTSRPTSSRCR